MPSTSAVASLRTPWATFPAADATGGDLERSLRDVPVRVWAELGRAQMQTGRVVGMPPGAVVELDRRAEDPVELYVNGLRFATGRLIVVDETEWAVKIESVIGASADVPEREVVD